MFNLTEVDGFFLEYEDERSGDFAPLRFVPESKAIVLGLVVEVANEVWGWISLLADAIQIHRTDRRVVPALSA